MAAAVADFRPAAPADHKLKKTGPEARSEHRARADRGRAQQACGQRRADQVLVGFAAEHGRGGRGLRAREARAQAPRRDRHQRHLARRHRLRLRRERGGDPHPRRRRAARPADAPRARSPSAVLDQVQRLREAAASDSASERRPTLSEAMDDVYELFSRGSALLADGHYHQAAVPLRRASRLSPESTSIREALGRALFLAQHYDEAAEEFRGGGRAGSHKRLCAVLPGPLPADARAVTRRRGSRWRWRPACSPSAATTAPIATARGDAAERAASPQNDAALSRISVRCERPVRADAGAFRCYARRTASVMPERTRWMYRKWALARFFYDLLMHGERTS